MTVFNIETPHNMSNLGTVSIETIDYCNRKCEWCPNKDREQNPNNIMSNEVFERVINELKTFDFKGDIHPYFRGEPLLDPHIFSRVRRLRKEFPNNKIRLNTNGDSFKYAHDIEKVLDAGVTAIHISHYDEPDLGKVLDGEFHRVTHFGMKALIPSFYNRAGLVDVPHNNGTHKFCTYPVLKLFILYNGNVVLCCSDFNEEVIFGNIIEKSLKEIWNNPIYAEYREFHVSGKGKELPMCDRCNII